MSDIKKMEKTDFGLQREIVNWRDFLDIANQLWDTNTHPDKSAYICRGQAKAEWHLTPSLLRHLVGRSATEALDVEKKALSEFRALAHLHLPATVIPHEMDLLAWWTLMQHYGAPTRILDWTASPFVAAYFAVEHHAEHDGAVWMAHVDELERFRNKNDYPGIPDMFNSETRLRNPEAPSVLYVLARTIQTDRMAAQQTAFTVSAHILTNHGDAITHALHEQHERQVPGSGEVPGYFVKFIIPARLKHDFLFRLRSMNITARSLFPGIDGLGRAVTEFVRLKAIT